METAAANAVLPASNGSAVLSGQRSAFEMHLQRLVTAIDATPEVFFITDADCRLTFVNPAFQAVTGYGIESVLGRTDEFLRATSEREKVRAYLKAVRQGREWIGELINRRSNGVTYPVEATISPISDMAGQFIGYVTCERDISDHKELEKKLRCEHGFVRSILHSLDSAIYALDDNFRLTHANEGWRSMPAEHAGIRIEGLPKIGKCLLDYVPNAARRVELHSLFRSVLANGRAEENSFIGADGKHWLMRVSPWIHGECVQGLICNVTDCTRQQELQRQLFQAQKMEIIGALAAGVAHDFNNLLQAIRGNNDLIFHSLPENSPLLRYTEQIKLATVRASEVTNQLLAFSRQSTEARRPLDLNQFIEETGQFIRRTLRSNIAIAIKPSTTPVHIKADPTRISQALLNLCINAQDAMPGKGRIVISASIEKLPAALAQRHGRIEDMEFACCSVADSGSGIPEEILAHIFEPFFTTKEKGKGTGLGLPIVQSVVHEAGGFVDVKTAPGEGTTFFLYLPVCREQVRVAPQPVHQPLDHGRGRVLVVEDFDLLRDFNKNFLEAAGMTVAVASNALDALAILEKQPVDLVFTDYGMPGMNGLELIEEVSRRWPKVQRVLTSGFLDEACCQKLVTLNATVVNKPYDMESAAKLIISLLSKQTPAAGTTGG